MKDTDSNKTEPIQELLASKQKEKPGTEFFENFSDQILTRLEEPAPKPTLRERLSENVDPFRAAAALFAVAVGCALIIGLDEGSTIAETEPVPLGQAEQEMMADVPTPPPTPSPLGQAQEHWPGSACHKGQASTPKNSHGTRCRAEQPHRERKPPPEPLLLKQGSFAEVIRQSGGGAESKPGKDQNVSIHINVKTILL